MNAKEQPSNSNLNDATSESSSSASTLMPSLACPRRVASSETPLTSRKRPYPHMSIKRVRHAKILPSDFERTCVVCGNKAFNYNYGVICCESCKMFFRRNSWKMESLRCIQDRLGECNVSFADRRDCSACRLKKCLDCGMLRELNSFEWRELNKINEQKMKMDNSYNRSTLFMNSTTESPLLQRSGAFESPPSIVPANVFPTTAGPSSLSTPYSHKKIFTDSGDVSMKSIPPLALSSACSSSGPYYSETTPYGGSPSSLSTCSTSTVCRPTLRSAILELTNAVLTNQLSGLAHKESSLSKSLVHPLPPQQESLHRISNYHKGQFAMERHLAPSPSWVLSAYNQSLGQCNDSVMHPAFHSLPTFRQFTPSASASRRMLGLEKLEMAQKRSQSFPGINLHVPLMRINKGSPLIPSPNGAFSSVKSLSESRFSPYQQSCPVTPLSIEEETKLAFVLDPFTQNIIHSDPYAMVLYSLTDTVLTTGSENTVLENLTRMDLHMLGEMEHSLLERLLKAPFCVDVAKTFREPLLENICTARRALSTRIVHYCKSIPHFRQLGLEQQTRVMLTRLCLMMYHIFLVNFDQLTGKVIFAVEDNTLVEYHAEEFHEIISFKYPVTSRHVEYLHYLVKVMGPCRRNQALFLTMKLFEVLPKHEQVIGAELSSLCYNLFSIHAKLLLKALHAELPDQHSFEDRWRAFCNLYVWGRHEFDVKTEEGVRVLYEEQPGLNALIDDLASHVKMLLSQA